MKRLQFLAVILMGCLSLARADTSRLWGMSGEHWSADSRLPDFSHAGYHAGSDVIPDEPVVTDVKECGAAGDGRTDDTLAFLAAIKIAEHGAIFVPEGRYLLTRQLVIDKSHIVLRGAGRDKTVLYFSKSLTQAEGRGKKYAPGGSWSWSGGFVSFEGTNKGAFLTAITSPAQRGDTSLTVASTDKLFTGQKVRIVMTNTDGALGRLLLANQLEGPKGLRGSRLVDFSVKILSLDRTTVTLDRPLRVALRPEWKAGIEEDLPSVQEVGVEDLTIEFPAVPEAAHHEEPGFNAIEFSGVSQGWARRLRLVNCDNGIFLRDGTKFCTIESVILEADRAKLRTGYGGAGENTTLPVGGHQALTATGGSQDNLFTDFQINLRFIHDLSVSAYAAGNVFAEGSAIDISLDHHRRVPYENLFTHIEGGEGTRLWESGGDAADGPHSGVRETFWNIRTRQSQLPPPWAMETIVVGVRSTTPATVSGQTLWFEPIPPERLNPPDLYQAQKTYFKSKN